MHLLPQYISFLFQSSKQYWNPPLTVPATSPKWATVILANACHRKLKIFLLNIKNSLKNCSYKLQFFKFQYTKHLSSAHCITLDSRTFRKEISAFPTDGTAVESLTLCCLSPADFCKQLATWEQSLCKVFCLQTFSDLIWYWSETPSPNSGKHVTHCLALIQQIT